MSLQALIERKLRDELEPSHLEVINESGMHNAPAGAESHFKVVVVSEKFEGACLGPFLASELTLGVLSVGPVLAGELMLAAVLCSLRTEKLGVSSWSFNLLH